MGMFSFIFSLISMLLTLIAFIPLLGWLNWLFIPISVLSLIGNVVFYYIDLGLKQLARAGMIISLVSLVIGFIRLSLGWGIL
jgi:hypothetical protein